MTNSLPLDTIKTDGGTQSRASLNELVVDDYAQMIRDGFDFPPATVFYDGKRYWLADGFHRHAAYITAGVVELPVAVHQGDRRDAILYSATLANRDHGLQLSRDDKRRRVMTLLKDSEWGQWSDSDIRKKCGVSLDLVRRCRADFTSLSLSEKSGAPPAPHVPDHVRNKVNAIEAAGGTARIYKNKHGDVAAMRTDKIGKSDHAPADNRDAFHRQRADNAQSLPPEIQAHEAAKAERGTMGSDHAADDDVHADDIEELRNVITAQQEEIADLRRTVAKYDDMAVEYERGGFENVITGLNERIENLKRQVERESKEKLKNLRSADYWKKKALEAGANVDIVVDMETGEMSRG